MEKTEKLKRLRALLTNYTRTNKDLYFKQSKRCLTLDLKSNNLDKLLKNQNYFLFNEKDVDKSKVKTLNKIRLADREYQREYGLSGAWLLGPFLCWRSSIDYKLEELAVSPLFKISVDIQKTKSGEWSLVPEDTELTVNPSLRLFMKNSWGIEMPETVSDINEVYNSIISGGKALAQIDASFVPLLLPKTRAIRDEDGEIISREKVDIKKELPAEQLELYQDTSDSLFFIVDQFVCSHINASRMALVSDYDNMIEESCEHTLIDELLIERKLPLKLETVDLDRIPETQNKLVMQTDAAQHQAIMACKQARGIIIQGPPGTGKSQTITNLIGQLLSEKKSVLFVSEKRAALDVVYSRLSSCGLKNNTCLIHSHELEKKEFYKSFLKNTKLSTGQADWEKASKELESSKESFNELHSALEASHYSGLPNIEVVARASSENKIKPEQLDLSIEEVLGKSSYSELTKTQEKLIQTEQIIAKHPFYTKSPWLYKNSSVVDTASFKQNFIKLAEQLESIKKVENKELLLKSEEPLNLLKKNFPVSLFVSSKFNSWDSFYPRLRKLEEIIEQNSALVGEIDPTATIEQVKELLEHFSKNHSFFSWFSSNHRKMKKLKRRIQQGKDIINPLSKYKAYIESKRADGELKNITKGKDLGELEAIYQAYKRFKEVLPNDSITELDALLETLSVLKEISAYFKKPISNVGELVTTFDHIQEVEQIDNLIGNPQLKDYILTKLVNQDEDWASYVLSSYLTTWADQIKTDYPVIRKVMKGSYEQALLKMSESEKEHRKLASHIIVSSCFAEGDSLGLDLIRKETKKKRRIRSPRELMEKGGLETMLDLKPCWLMSPLSISQMLPLENGLFDYVIFDEASQVVIEDALPAIYRGKSLVIVGDENQMPPTNFFKSKEDFDEEELEELPESILDMALNVYPEIPLKGHYRSKSQDLISFSNKAFYNGELRAVPNASKQTAFKFHELRYSYFNFKKGNPEEAKAVVERLEEILTDEPKLSVGILAMGMSQMDAIEAVIDDRCEEDSNFRKLIEKSYTRKSEGEDIGLFLKNLENIQGDERDVILMSVGYAPSGPKKKLRKSFGPLSARGGSRRLNVAITRAKRRMEVFCSFNPSEVDIKDSANKDFSLFINYLNYVKALDSADHNKAKKILNSFDCNESKSSKYKTFIADQVAARLTEKGYLVEREVGNCGYFLDMAIRLGDEYVLGIECDGASFYSPNYARERDLSRHHLLKSRGWEIYRLSLNDWLKDPDGEIQEIEQKLGFDDQTKTANGV